MKLNKKECRKYADPGWRLNLNNGLLHAEQIEYIIRTAVKNIGGQRVLILYIYQREQALAGKFTPLWVMFQSRHEYVTLARKDDGSVFWRTAAFENLDRVDYISKKCAFYTPLDEIRIVSFCKNGHNNGVRCLSALQSGLRYHNWLEKKRKKERHILNKMKTVHALPRGLKGWVVREVMPAYIFYDYREKGKQIEGYCTACKKVVRVSDVRHNKRGICPSCKKEVIFKSRGRRGRIMDRDTAQVFQRVSEQEFVIRIIKIYQNYSNQDTPEVNIYESARIFVRWDNPGSMIEDHYYKSYDPEALTPWKKGDRPVFYIWNENFEADNCGFLYLKNLDAVLQDTPWQYSQLKAFCLSNHVRLYTPDYLKRYLEYPALEFMVKLRLYRLARDIVYSNYRFQGKDAPLNLEGRNIKEALGVDKSLVPLLQKTNPGYRQMKLIRQLFRQGVSLNEELLRWCSDHDVSREENLTVPLQYMTPYKLIKYAEEQFGKSHEQKWTVSGSYRKMEDLLTDYRDYLCMSEALEYDLQNSFVLFPAKIKEAHDRVNDFSDKKQKKLYDRQIKKMFSVLNERYRFAKGGFVVIPPHSSKEIVEEGHKLHHCVGGYIKQIVKRESIILFVRKRNEIDKPLCTLEIKGNEVVQARIMQNYPPTAEIQRFLDLWEREVLNAPALPVAA